jgi:hypothetical protein
MLYCDEFPGVFYPMKTTPIQLELPLIWPEDLYPETIFDQSDKEYYVTFKVEDGATMSGTVIGRRKNGDFIVDPGGSGYYLFEARFDQIVNIYSEIF